MMRILLLAAALLCVPAVASAQDTFKPGIPVSDTNPAPRKSMCWTGTVYAACGSVGTPSSSASSSITPVVGSLVSSIPAKTTAGNLYAASVTTGSDAGYLYVFNATAAPADGAVIAGTTTGRYQICSAVAATATFTTTFEIPERYSVGIIPVFSSTPCGFLTKVATPVFLKARVQ